MKDAIERSSAFTLAGVWEPLERHAGEAFRWVAESAEIVVAVLRRVEYRIDITVEPGPHGGPLPMPFELVDVATETVLKTAELSGRRAVAFALPSGPPRVVRLRLRAPGATRPVTGRALGFRVFSVEIRPLPGDVVPQAAGFLVGRDWGRIETYNDENFRWASNDVFVEAREEAVFPLVLEVEGGPSLGPDARLDVIDDASGTTLLSTQLAGRRTISIERGDLTLPGLLRLTVAGGGLSGASDARVLNFRALEAPSLP